MGEPGIGLRVSQMWLEGPQRMSEKGLGGSRVGPALDGGYLSSSLDIKKRVGEQLHFYIICEKNPHMKLCAQMTYEEPF